MPREETPKLRKALSLSDKIELLSYYNETKCSIRKLAKHFNIGKTQAGLIIKKQNIIYENWLSGSPGEGDGRKRLSSAGLQIDKIVYEWYLKQKSDHLEVNGPMLQSKARETANDLNLDEFKASNGWLAKFVKRHGILFKNQDKKKDDTASNDASMGFYEWSQRLASVLPNYSADDIFVAVPTGLFFRAAPDETSILSKRTCSRGTLSSERLTILLCTSMTAKKEKPLVVADISFTEDLEVLQSPEVNCKSFSKVLLTQSIMNSWLKEMNGRMLKQNRKILLFLDHLLPCHDCELSNIETVCFPSFLSSKDDPANQSIIQNFKIIYRVKLLKYLITIKDNDINSCIPDDAISISEAVAWISSAWKELSDCVTLRCFEELCFNIYVQAIKVTDEEQSITLNDISDLLCAYDSIVNAADYINIDDNLVTTEEDFVPVEVLVDSDDLKQMHLPESDEEVHDEPENAIPPEVSNFYLESVKGLKQLEQFYLLQNDSNGLLLVKKLLTHHENVLRSKNVCYQSL